MRSGFLAQPGKAASLRLRARRTRLDMTMRSCGPFAPRALGRRDEKFVKVHGVQVAAELPSRAVVCLISSRKHGGLLEIFGFDGLGRVSSAAA